MLARAGTSVGANLHEAQYAQSKKDFVAKLEIALKESNEASYWLKLMCETKRIDSETYQHRKGDKNMIILYRIIQCTWGFLQTLLGFVIFILNIKSDHFSFRGAIVTKWKNSSSVSLGMFVFITEKPFFAEKLSDCFSEEELFSRLLVHEYGHTVQSLILGPLYLLLMGIPSTLWGFLPSLAKKRREARISYFSFFTESWANALGERVCKEKSMENLVID